MEEKYEPKKLPKNDRKEIFGWLMYDWANSVFFTTVVTALIGQYVTALAQTAVGENGVVLSLGFLGSVTAKSLFPYSVGLSVFVQVFFLPLMGAIADYTNLKKTFLAFFCYLGSFATCLLFFVEGDLYLMGTLVFIVANLAAGASIVFYNSYLPDITDEKMRDKVSSWGFATGYISGSLMLAVNLLILSYSDTLGITKGMAVRICLLSAGIWWGGFSIFTFLLLKKRQPAREVPPGKNVVIAGFGELKDTFKELFKLKQTLMFLIAYLLYNDGIQTVISQSGVFLTQELFVAKGLEIDTSFLLIALLIAQVIGLFGAIAFELLSRKTSTKIAIIISLIIWSLVVIYGYSFLDTIYEAYFMSGAIGFVLGGSQALSRSLFSKMIPEGRESAFFGIYEISERGTSWIGPIVFGLVASITNSYRQAILALIFFFIVGSIILFFTDTDKAIRDAGNRTPEEAADV